MLMTLEKRRRVYRNTLYLSCVALSCVIPLLTGCSSDSAMASAAKSAFTLSSAKVWLEKVKFNICRDVNDNSPVAVHVLIIYDADAFSKFSAMPADEYFKNQKQYQKDFGSGKIDFFSWEVVPGQLLPAQVINPSKVSGVGALVFARYSSPGDHRVNLGEDRVILIQLNKLDFSVIPSS